MVFEIEEAIQTFTTSIGSLTIKDIFIYICYSLDDDKLYWLYPLVY